MKALVLEQQDKATLAEVKEIALPDMAAGDVLVDISWSGLNYKDALAITGKGKIIRQFPMVQALILRAMSAAATTRVSPSGNPSFSPAGASAKRTGAVWRSRLASKVTGWSRCRKVWLRAMP